ncbi:uncharacterized protein J5F26_011358 isoform 1-T1 [Ciconia maguari]
MAEKGRGEGRVGGGAAGPALTGNEDDLGLGQLNSFTQPSNLLEGDVLQVLRTRQFCCCINVSLLPMGLHATMVRSIQICATWVLCTGLHLDLWITARCPGHHKSPPARLIPSRATDDGISWFSGPAAVPLREVGVCTVPARGCSSCSACRGGWSSRNACPGCVPSQLLVHLLAGGVWEAETSLT